MRESFSFSEILSGRDLHRLYYQTLYSAFHACKPNKTARFYDKIVVKRESPCKANYARRDEHS